MTEALNLKQKLTALRAQLRHQSLDDVERMLNHCKGTGITPALVEACLRSNRTLAVHSDTWKEKLEASNPKLKVKTTREIRGGEFILIDNGINHMILVEARALQRMVEDLLNYIEAKKIEDKP